MKIFQTKLCRKSKKHILRPIMFVRKLFNLEIMWENIVQPARPQIIHQARNACRTTRDKKTHNVGYVTLTAFPRQQWMHERASTLHHTYTVGLVNFFIYSFSGDVMNLPAVGNRSAGHKRITDRVWLTTEQTETWQVVEC